MHYLIPIRTGTCTCLKKKYLWTYVFNKLIVCPKKKKLKKVFKILCILNLRFVISFYCDIHRVVDSCLDINSINITSHQIPVNKQWKQNTCISLPFSVPSFSDWSPRIVCRLVCLSVILNSTFIWEPKGPIFKITWHKVALDFKIKDHAELLP